ncbi:hypothetical protein CERSUDRAFT_115908 [Gelatoporia subvermispora B]|uniref:Cytochrome P450 n=1 Tax=Ceriporiopsis subvermispora (strain B) TaxID=914234 RepID=M2QV71_CERS8|nr:hypothetical protein CERSUDRAFT_115908 [Gelatoporia subvermispora B]
MVFLTFGIRELTLALVFVGVFIAIRRWRYARRSKGLPMPPGPPGKLLVGSIMEISQYEAPRALARYGEKYGDLVMFKGLGNHALVLNSLQAMNDLLDKRGNNNSHRPISIYGGELLGLNESVVFLPYGEEWRAQRKLAHMALSSTAIKQYCSMQEDIAAILAKDLLDSPDDFFASVRMSAGRVVIAVTYGIPSGEIQTECINLGERALEIGSKAVAPGNYLCDLLPFLKHAPSWVSFQREARESKKVMFSHKMQPYEYVKREVAAGSALPSLMRDLMTNPPKGETVPETRLQWLGSSMFGAGSETTYATILTLIMAMALFPEKQKFAQAEIDRVLGFERLPTIQDRERLPYVDAVVKEAMRWQPAVHMGVPRRSAEDDVYDGYFIPKGTIFIPNVWAIAYAPNARYDPEAFIPERYLDPKEDTVDPSLWAFGFGRRICPGRFLAENSIFIFAATILAAFNISPPADGQLEKEFTQQLVRSPKPFQCQITPRSAAKAKLVEARAAASVV